MSYITSVNEARQGSDVAVKGNTTKATSATKSNTRTKILLFAGIVTCLILAVII